MVNSENILILIILVYGVFAMILIEKYKHKIAHLEGKLNKRRYKK